jgi:hypothetical protein
MRRLLWILCSVAALFVSSGAALAEDERLPSDVGLLAGINLLQVDVDPLDTKVKVGATVGAYYNLELNPWVSVEINAMYSYSRVGLKHDHQAAVQLEEQTPSVHRIALPVLARYWVMPGVSVGAGAFALINAGDNVAGQADVDGGLVASTSMKYPLGRLQVIMDLRYLWGLADVGSGHIGTREFQALMGAGYFL